MVQMAPANNPPKIRADRRPLYMQAEDAFAAVIANAAPGERLPSEPDLAQMLGISRTTLREAIRSFERRGLITRKPGVGTFVMRPHAMIESGLEQLESLNTLAARLGLETEVADSEFENGAANAEEAAALQLRPESGVIRIRRKMLASGEPIAFLEDVLPEGILQESDLAAFNGSVLDILLQRDDLQLSNTRTDLTSEPADERLARRLALEPGSPLLLLKSSLYTRKGSIIDYSHSYFVPGHFKFHVVRRIENE